MQHCTVRRFAILLCLGLHLPACQKKPEAQPNIPPRAAEFTGEALQRVRLTARRAEQLGIKTAPIREEEISGTLRKIIPAAAVVYDHLGTAWVFKCPESLVFIRERISIERIDGEVAILSDGPPAGTAVVIAGAAGLLSDQYTGAGESGVGPGAEGEAPASTATLLEDGTLKVVHRATGKSGLSANVVVIFRETDKEYQQIISQVGGLKTGETKSVDLDRLEGGSIH